MMCLQKSLLLLCLIVTTLAASEAAAQIGYYRAYRPDPYRDYRELNRTGKYHGYWRDLGYGFRSQPDYYYPDYGVPYYNVYPGGVPYEIVPAPNYYHPPASFPYRYRY